jgi:hypothetical protein
MMYSSCHGTGNCGGEKPLYANLIPGNGEPHSNYQIVADAYANGSNSHSSPGYINTNHPDAAKYKITSI